MLKPLVALMLAIPLSAQAVQYKVTDLGVGSSVVGTEWFGYWGGRINNQGEVLASLESPLVSGSGQYYARPAYWNGANWRIMPEIAGREGTNWSYYGNGVNDQGLVVGGSGLTAAEFDDTMSGQYQGFIWNTKTNQVTTFGAPPFGGESIAEDINTQGVVAGTMGTTGSNATTRAMVWNAGVFSLAINPTITVETQANRINEHGHIAGQFVHPPTGSIGALYIAGAQIYSTSFPGYAEYEVEDMNDAGLIAINLDNGCDQNGCDRKGVIWNPLTGAIVEIESTGGGTWGAEVSGMNNLGQVVGAWMERSEGALLWDASNGVQPLNQMLAPGTEYTIFEATDINDSGVILARGAKLNTHYTESSLLLLTPVPEPETYALMLAGLGLVGIAARRAHKLY